jgi:hypothetical protein
MMMMMLMMLLMMMMMMATVLLSERPGMNLPFFMFSFTLFLIIFDYSLGLKERSLTFGAF